METVHDTDAVLEAIAPTGIRATVGKCLMDDGDAPARLHEPWRAGIDARVDLHRRWHGQADGGSGSRWRPLRRVAADAALGVSPRSPRPRGSWCTPTPARIATEVAFVRARTGLGNMAYLAQLGLALAAAVRGPLRVGRRRRRRIMAERGVQVLHCPGSNLKLVRASPIVALRAQGIGVSLGADGAACNNRLDMFDEMRLAATLQAERHGPGSLTARDVLLMATEGAQALGLDAEIGSIAPGKRADLYPAGRRAAPRARTDPWSTLVYGPRHRRGDDHGRRPDPGRGRRPGRPRRRGRPGRVARAAANAHEPGGGLL